MEWLRDHCKPILRVAVAPFLFYFALLLETIFHELGHYVLASYTGTKVNEVSLSLGSSYIATDVLTNDSNRLWVLLGGPLFSLILGGIALSFFYGYNTHKLLRETAFTIAMVTLLQVFCYQCLDLFILQQMDYHDIALLCPELALILFILGIAGAMTVLVQHVKLVSNLLHQIQEYLLFKSLESNPLETDANSELFPVDIPLELLGEEKSWDVVEVDLY